jgi:pimeloyl-ACP methyl ester carboxylesterase
MGPVSKIVIGCVGASLLAIAPACDRASADTHDQPTDPPAWRDALRRFEQKLDDALGELTWTETKAEPVAGMLIPADDTPQAAARMPSQWNPLADAPATPARAVLLIHGLDEPGDIWMDLAPALVEAGYPVLRFDYPNDQRVHDSALMLLDALRRAHDAGLRDITIIAHSMGGLVSFDALTRDDGYAGDFAAHEGLPRVTRFIAVGVPWEGSPWARYRALAEIREQVTRMVLEESWDPRPALDYRRDGSGQAGPDLMPGSALITELQARPWPEGLPITTLVGHISRPDPAGLDQLADSKLLLEMLGQEKLDSLLADLGQAAADLGDGVVSVNSAGARATDDLHTFKVNHRALIRHSPLDFVTGQEAGGPPGIAVILERLEADRAQQDK